jgi:hypothetical protein
MVGLGRVELPTNGLGNRCSIHLSYRPDRVPAILSRVASAASNFHSRNTLPGSPKTKASTRLVS